MSLQETMDTLLLRIQAGFPLIYLVTQEEPRVLANLVKLTRLIPQKHFLRWSEGLGLDKLVAPGRETLPANTDAGPPYAWLDLEGIPREAVWRSHAGNQADDALRRIREAGQGPGMTPDPTLENCVVVFFDIHRRISSDDFSADLVRPLRTTCNELRRYYESCRDMHQPLYKTIVVIGPSAAKLSPELEGDISIIEFPLPEKDELERALSKMLDRGVLTFPESIPPEDMKTVLSGRERGAGDAQNEAAEAAVNNEYRMRLREMIANAGRGLTLDAYRLGLNSFAVRDRVLRPDHIETMLNIKADAVAKMPALEYTPHVNVELGGLKEIKEWVAVRLGAVTSDDVRRKYALPAPKGALLCGAAGGGKSQLARFMAKAFGLALLRLDVGALFGSYVGESEDRTRRALRLAETLAPVVLWLDEIDKAFKGGTGNSGDGGVSARVFGHFLTWLAEKQDAVFVVATANDFRDLLGRFPEFGRKGRFDLICWAGLPDVPARRDIFKIYLRPLLEHQPQGPGGDKYLQIHDDITRSLAAKNDLPSPQGDSALDRFCDLLSHNNISLNMTGAEIEAAVNDAKYAAFDRDRGHQRFDTLTQDLVFHSVREASQNALYKGHSPDGDNLEILSREASKRGWLGAQQAATMSSEEQSPSAASRRAAF